MQTTRELRRNWDFDKRTRLIFVTTTECLANNPQFMPCTGACRNQHSAFANSAFQAVVTAPGRTLGQRNEEPAATVQAVLP